MKIRRYEDRPMAVLIEYDIEADTINEAVQKLKDTDNTLGYRLLEKKLCHFNSNALESDIKNNEPAYIDEEDYWMVEVDNEWVEIG